MRDREAILDELERIGSEDALLDAQERELRATIRRRREENRARVNALREELANAEQAPIRRFIQAQRRDWRGRPL